MLDDGKIYNQPSTSIGESINDLPIDTQFPRTANNCASFLTGPYQNQCLSV
jgi:hypothetical protein